MKIEVTLPGGQMTDFVNDCNVQGWEETDMPAWIDTRENGDLVWLISLRWDGFPE